MRCRLTVEWSAANRRWYWQVYQLGVAPGTRPPEIRYGRALTRSRAKTKATAALVDLKHHLEEQKRKDEQRIEIEGEI